MSYASLKNQIAVVTGGLSGIGLEATIKLLKNGAKVLVGDITAEEKVESVLDTIKKRSGSNNVRFVRTDVSDYAANKNLVDQAVKQFGDLNLVFANAGIGQVAPAHEIPYEQLERIVNVNLNGVFSLNKEAITYWINNGKTGNIVNTGSFLSFVGDYGLSHYCASKAGVKLLTQTLAIEYAAKGIRVNSVNPGYTDTPILKDVPKETRELLISRHPIGRLGTPQEIANAVIFLLSDQATFINGTSLLVDGGYTAQ
ncbi:(R)-2-octanol dehydrogenase [Scheffersomyces amazonensis]|uniref:(R)-2-octanol dehydrogenase n=1 Tax=Scheffersomyces amazonensis TaxID=1078765 RepID=UPI00315D6B67